MSKNERELNTQNNQPTEEETREPLTIEVETVDFKEEAVGIVNFRRASDLCAIVNAIFRPVFEDFEGSKFVINENTNHSYIELWFHHRLPESDETTTAFSQLVDAGNYKNKTFQRVMTQDRVNREGNTYHVTQDAKDAIAKFICPEFKDKKGNVNWKNICRDTVQPTNNYATNFKEVLSCISGISAEAILRERYGTKNEEGSNVQYSVESKFSLPTFNGTPDYWLQITQVVEDQLDSSLRSMGFINPNGLGIVH